MTQPLRAPFPYFGGKSRAAALVWSRFGDVANYIEPFAGSLAVLLARPHAPRAETVNDKNCYLSNFWRALAADPAEVARWADWPVSEIDLRARHRWLLGREEFREAMRLDPHHYDAKIAGWWVWGANCAIAEVWNRESPQTRCATRQGGGPPDPEDLKRLAARLKSVRVLCGDWRRAVTDARLGPDASETGILLDPPYDAGDGKIYGGGNAGLSSEVRAWAIEHGEHRRYRIALCGYEGEHAMPASWECVAWKAAGGFANRNSENLNKHRERIWFSPGCLRAQQGSLF